MLSAPTLNADTSRVVRVERTIYYDACATEVFFLRVPEGVSDGDIEENLSDADLDIDHKMLDCGAEVISFTPHTEGDVEANLLQTGTVDVDRVEQLTAAQLAAALKSADRIS